MFRGHARSEEDPMRATPSWSRRTFLIAGLTGGAALRAARGLALPLPDRPRPGPGSLRHRNPPRGAGRRERAGHAPPRSRAAVRGGRRTARRLCHPLRIPDGRHGNLQRDAGPPAPPRLHEDGCRGPIRIRDHPARLLSGPDHRRPRPSPGLGRRLSRAMGQGPELRRRPVRVGRRSSTLGGGGPLRLGDLAAARGGRPRGGPQPATQGRRHVLRVQHPPWPGSLRASRGGSPNPSTALPPSS